MFSFFLPHNHLILLHALELACLILLALDLWARHLRRPALALTYLQRRIVVRTPKIIGTDPGRGGVRLPGSQVSRRHIEARHENESLVVQDLGSTNGTFVDGQDLRTIGPAKLSAGGQVMLGRGGPELTCVAIPPAGLLPRILRFPTWLALLWSSLYLSWRSNNDLPKDGVAVDGVAVDFSTFLAPWPWIGIGAFASLIGWLYFRRHGIDNSDSDSNGGVRSPAYEAGIVVLILSALGLSILLQLLPAIGWRYAQLAVNAFQNDAPTSGHRFLVLATNLAARQGEAIFSITYFRQAFVLLLALLVGLVLPLYSERFRQLAKRGLELLRQPISPSLIRAADEHARWRWLRPLAYWDVLCGFAAVLIIALTLWTPLGTDLGRAKNLYLDLPGLPTIQSVELVKTFFVLFMTGYFARHGALLAAVPRRRYLVPFVLAVLGTLVMTGAQADMGALFMLSLFLALVFLAATGNLRLLFAVPLVVLPGLGVAWLLGLTSILNTRFGIWLAPRLHERGEQVVQARQLLLSSGWSGYEPKRLMAHNLPDVQGDLVFAALSERLGTLGLLALVLCWFVLVASLLRGARRARPDAALLLASVASLLLVQNLTQAGGTMGLLPLTGVPLPWLSHGLSASLIFTVLIAFALAVAGTSSARKTSTGKTSSTAQLRFVSYANIAATAVLAALVVYWTFWEAREDAQGKLGRSYVWQNEGRQQEIQGWIEAGFYEPQDSRGRLVTLSESGQGQSFEQSLRHIASDLRYANGEIRIPSYLYIHGNRFANRSRPRGALLDRNHAPLAFSNGRGREYPMGEAFFHPIGYGGRLARDMGLEAAARSYLAGLEMTWDDRRLAFAADIHHGPDAVISLDAALQQSAYDALDGRSGAVVVMDLLDGALLALASSPAVDPQGGIESFRDAFNDRRRPLRNRALASTEVYSPPGSVFKIVIAAALLERGERPVVFCDRTDEELRVSCAHSAHGRVDLEKALVKSCNVYFARAAVDLGEEAIRETAQRFGFNTPDGPDQRVNLLRGLPAAILKPLPSTVLTESDLTPRDLARVGFGQGPVSATALQVARMGAVIATWGDLVDPFLAQATALVEPEGGSFRTIWERRASRSYSEQVLPRLVAEEINIALTQVMGPAGTGRNLPWLWWNPEDSEDSGSGKSGWHLTPARTKQSEPYVRVEIAGKTGSAWKTRTVGEDEDNAWMLAWAPADRPRILSVVLVESSGEGGRVAGPIAIELLRHGLEVVNHRIVEHR